MMPSEAYSDLFLSSKSPAKRLIDSSYKSNPFQNHQLFCQSCHQTKDFYRKEFLFPDPTSFNFSKNGDFFVAGMVKDGKVALWNTTQFLGTSVNPKPALMDFEHGLIRNVTTSPDDLKIFSNALKIRYIWNDTDGGIAIHDVNT